VNIYVGGLSPETTEADLLNAFGRFGRVSSVTIVRDKLSCEPRGFAFVDIPDEVEAHAAVNYLDNSQLMGRRLTVMPYPVQTASYTMPFAMGCGAG